MRDMVKDTCRFLGQTKVRPNGRKRKSRRQKADHGWQTDPPDGKPEDKSETDADDFEHAVLG